MYKNNRSVIVLSREKYVITSLELHLFFARIMKEHAIFLEAGFTPKDSDFSQEADSFKEQFEDILADAVQVSNGFIREDVLSSGEIVTDFTAFTEQKTQDLTGIAINENITHTEKELQHNNYARINPNLARYVRQLNHRARRAVHDFIRFKERLLKFILSCEMFTTNYPLLIEHILREARLYQSYLISIESRYDIDDRDIRQTELFWNQIMMEHALFIRGLLDPTENELITTANDFADDYAVLLKAATEATDLTLDSITDETLAKTIEYRDFKRAGTEGISGCKIRGIIVPLLADHVLREANHYIRLLER